MNAVVISVVQPILHQFLINLGEQLAQIVLFVQIQIVQVGAAVQLLPHQVDFHDQFGELTGLGQRRVFQNVAVVVFTLVQMVMQTEKVHFFHIQMEGIILQLDLCVLIVRRLPVHGHIHDFRQRGRMGIKTGQISQHIAARFVEEQGFDDGKLALIFLFMGLFDQTIQEQGNQNDLQRHTRQLVEEEDSNVVQIAENQIVQHVQDERCTQQQENDLLHGKLMAKWILHGRAPF